MSEEKPEPKPWHVFVGCEERTWVRGIRRLEWICERASWRFSRWAFIDVLEHIGKLSLLGALILWIWGIPARKAALKDQQTAKHFQAWQTLNSADGKRGDAGRREALEELCKDGVNMAGINLSQAELRDIRLFRAELSNASFSNTTLRNVGFFDETDLSEASFIGADLFGYVFHECGLRRAKFINASCGSAREAQNVSSPWKKDKYLNQGFQFCDLSEASFQSSIVGLTLFYACDLRGADFRGADLTETDFSYSVLDGANFAGATNWQKISSMEGANVMNLSNAPAGFLEMATNKLKAVALPIPDYGEWLKRFSKLPNPKQH